MDAIFNFNDYERDRFIKEVAASLPTGLKVLDAGAGTCKYKSLFSHCEYKAQDFAKYTGKEHPYGELDYVGDIANIDAPDCSFDFILCTEVFEHIPRPDLAINEFSRLLKTGGELVITAPLGSGIHMAPYHFYGGFSPYWYQHFLKDAGFKVDSIQPNGGFFKLYGQESRRFLGLLTPKNKFLKVPFFFIKMIFSVWFRLMVPLACHFLDKFDPNPIFTVGYFVRATKL